MSREDFLERMRAQISSGIYPVGARLPSERELAEAHGISRSVVREGLRTLAEQRYIVVQAGRGAFVKAPSSGDAAEMFAGMLSRQSVTPRHVIHARRLLEPEIARLATLARPDVARLSGILSTISEQTPLLRKVEADLAFHLELARASGNPVLEAMFASISAFTTEIMLRSLADSAVADRALPQHDEIVAAITAGDAERAHRLMTQHLSVAEELYGADLDRPLEQVTAASGGFVPDLDAIAERVIARGIG